jgi:CRISPR-associated protein Csy1
MSDSPVAGSTTCFREAIDAFLHDRLQTKLNKLKPDDPKRAELIAEYQRAPWLQDAAKRVKQIQAVTHSLKAIHPDARGTNLYVAPTSLPKLEALGSHALGNQFVADVVGNAAALDVYKLLKLTSGELTLLQALHAGKAEALQALSDDPREAHALCEAFLGLTAARDVAASSHARAKQIYWLTGDDATDDSQYQLLMPLYATSLAQAVHEEIQDARFGEANKAARHARRNGEMHEGVYREYRDVAVQKMGGTKPQNISQLNSERGGNNYLLASLPPPFRPTQPSYLPVNAHSIFDRTFGARPSVRSGIHQLQVFLQRDPPVNVKTREKRRGMEDRLVDELFAYADQLLDQPPGWTRDSAFDDLAEDEKLWLDPLRTELPDEDEFASRWEYMDWPAKIGERFGKWVNGELQKKLPDVGFVESRNWRRALLNEDGSWVQQLRKMRERLDAPGYSPFRSTHDELMAASEAK